MKRLLLITALSSPVFASTNPDTLLGHWQSTEPCGFTVIDKTNAYSNQIATFDEGSFSKASSGPLIQIEFNQDDPRRNIKNAYVIKGLHDFLLVLKEGVFYGADGSEYHKK